MSNKEAIKLLKENQGKYALAYENGDLKTVNQINETVLNELNKMGKVPKNKQDNLKNFVLTHNLGNSKIGKDTICINVSSGLNCPMALLGECNNCAICYAVAQNKRHFRNTVPKNLINQNIVNAVVLGEVKLDTVICNLTEDIIKSYTVKEVENLKFIRFSVEGDILNNDILMVLDAIASFLIKRFDLLSAYAYTHNKELDLRKAPDIHFNTSDFEYMGNYYGSSRMVANRCNTIKELTPDLVEEVKAREVILCDGDCVGCSYCKNPLETRTIYFLAHGNGLKGVKQIPSDLLEEIQLFKYMDNVLFEKDFNKGEN